jgi:hypothetical protein
VGSERVSIEASATAGWTGHRSHITDHLVSVPFRLPRLSTLNNQLSTFPSPPITDHCAGNTCAFPFHRKKFGIGSRLTNLRTNVIISL